MHIKKDISLIEQAYQHTCWDQEEEVT